MSHQPRLTRKLILEERQTVADGGGGAIETWIELGRLWGSLRSRTAREVLVGERPASRVSHEIIIRAAPDGSPRRPTAEQRFRMGGRVFAIRGVAEAEGSSAFLRCWVEEGAN